MPSDVLFTWTPISRQPIVASEQFIIVTNEDILTVMGIPLNDSSEVWATLIPTVTLMPTLTPSPTPTPLAETGHLSQVKLPDAIAGAERITADNYEQVTLLNTFQHPSQIIGYSGVSVPNFSPDGSRFYTYGIATHEVFAWDTLTGRLLYDFVGHEAGIDRVVMSNDGSLLATLSHQDKTLRLWDALTGKLLDMVSFGAERYWYGSWLGFNPDTTKFIWDNPLDRANLSYVWSIKNRAFGDRQEFPVTGFFGFRCDGLPLTLNGLYIHSFPDGIPILNLRSIDDNIIWSPSGCNLLTFNSRQVSLRLLDLRSGQQVAALEGHTSQILDAAFDATGSVIASLDAEQSVHIWDGQTGKPLERLPALKRAILLSRGEYLVLEDDGIPVVHNTQKLLPFENWGGVFYLSPDGTTLLQENGPFFLVYGIPTAQRPAHITVPIRVKTISINVRQSPSVDAPIVTTAPKGIIIINGRNAAGTYLYSNTYAGWIRADAAYVDMGTTPIEVIPIKE